MQQRQFDTKRARKKLRRYVEGHDYAIRLKAEIMVDHFQEQVLALNKIGCPFYLLIRALCY